MKEPTYLYRYKATHYCGVDEFDDMYSAGTRIHFSRFQVVKKTPKGFWVIPEGSCLEDIEDPDFISCYRNERKRWVSSEARKRFAYPTKQEALESFIARKRRQVKILQAQAEKAAMARYQGEKLLTEVEEEGG